MKCLRDKFYIDKSEFVYKEFDGPTFLSGLKSFLKDPKETKALWPELDERCKFHNVAPQIALTYLQFRSGLLSRSFKPDRRVLNFCLGIRPFSISGAGRLKVNVFGMFNQIESLLYLLSKFHSEGEGNKGVPIWLANHVITPTSPESYAVISMFASQRWNVTELERFVWDYEKFFCSARNSRRGSGSASGPANGSASSAAGAGR